MAFHDAEDPLQGVRWTLGNPQPRRLSLNMPSNLALHWLIQYLADRQTVLLKYQAGEEEILPPLAFTPSAYADEAFRRGLRKAWIQDTDKSLAESNQRGGAPEGLIDISLPNLPFTSRVFGDGAPNLRVRGSEQITISGSSSWVVGQVTGEQGGNSLFPKLDMRQRLNVNLDGTIGSKLSISMAQNSDALTPLENSIKIRYKGLDDEVLKSVELGNTNLSLPSTQFISYSTRQEGLFGVKTEAEVGGVSLTAIASREQGESGQSTFTGGASARVIRVPDWNYVEGKYFFLINPNDPAAPTGPIVDMHVYLDNKTPYDDVQLGAQPARVWLDPKAKTPSTPARGEFHLLKLEEDYTSTPDPNFSFTRITLNTPLSRNQTLAVAYIQTNGAVSDTVGTWKTEAATAPTDSLDLKMLRPSEEEWGPNDLTQSVWAPVRFLESKNVYSLQVHDIEPGSLTLDIVQDVAGPDGQNPNFLKNEFNRQTPLLQILGLDQKNNANPSDRTPDQRIDPEFVDLANGLIFFPDLRPFDPNAADIEGTTARLRSWPRAAGVDRPDTLGWYKDRATETAVPSSAETRSKETIPEIYDLMERELSATSAQHHLYTIEATVKAAISSTIQLGFGGVLQNSETVRLNGQELKRGEGYTIDYDTGTVTLKDPEATAPGADLVINYSQDALFSRGSHSLFGASMSTGNPNSALSVSSTWLHESRGVPDLRPRLRQEPTKTTVGDFAARLKVSPWFLTDLVDKLPLVHVNTPSHLEVNAAAGISLPNPNTKGDVYIDDMEGAEQTVSTGVSRVNWFYSSTPESAYDFSSGFPTKIVPALADTERGEMLWFSPNTVQVGDLTPREDNALTRNDAVPALEVIYVPSELGGTPRSWGGLVTSLANADVARKQYLQVWVNDYIPFERAAERRGDILIDVGQISEDAVWDPQTPPRPANKALDYEDLNKNGGQVEANEDRGLDTLFTANEPPRRPGSKVFSPNSPTQDPSGDNRVPQVDENAPENTISQRIKKYQGINGTEGNQRLDTEDLNGDYAPEFENTYLEYRISLADSAFIDNRRDFPDRPQDPRSGWRMYRIPISKAMLDVGGIPNLSQVKALRMWFRGIAPGDTLDLQVASVEIVGNNWELADSIQADPSKVMNVGVVNNKQDANYIEPFPVRRVDNVKEKEQSISLDFENLDPGKEFRAFRRLQDTYDYTLYQTVGYYINPQFQSIPDDTVEFFMRFGSDAATDTASYYEVATRLTQNDPRRRADGWIDVQFPVTDLSQFKIGAPAILPADEYLVGPKDIPDTTVNPHTRARANIGNGLLVTIRGNPSMSRVRRLSVGLRNISGHVLREGSVWYDELRMGDVRRDMGWATSVRASMTLADFADMQGTLSVTDPDFLRLGDTRGSGTETVQYDLRGQVWLHKFMEPLHLIAPLQVRLSHQRMTPKFIPNNDILFSGTSSTGNEITEVANRGMDLSVSRDVRGYGNPILRYTLDSIRLTGSLDQAFRDDVTRADSTWRVVGTGSYNLGLGDIRPLRPLHLISLRLWPSNVSANLTEGRVETRSWIPGVDSAAVSTTRTGNLTLSTTVQPISGLTYNYASNRDLIDDHFDIAAVQRDRPPDIVAGVNLGRPVQVTHGVTFGYTPPLLGRVLSPRFTWSGSSAQSLDPNLTLEDYEHAVFGINNVDNASLSFSIPLGRFMDKVVRKPPPAGGTRPARPKRGAGADSTGAAKPQGGTGVRDFFTKIVRLKDIQTTSSLGHRSSYSGVYGDPSLEYRLGLTRDIGLNQDVFKEANASYNNTIGRNTSIRGTTSVTLLGQVDVDMSFQKTNNQTETNQQPGLVRDETTWPDLRFNWGDLQKKIPILRRLFSDFRVVSTSFDRTTQVQGTLTNPDETTTTTNRWSPLVSVQGTLPGNWKTQLNANLSSSETLNNSLGSASTSTTRNQNSYQLSLNKRFQGGQGSGAKDVDVKVDLTYSKNTSENRSSSSDRVQEDAADQFRLNSTATLRLTRALSGTFGLELGQERRPTSDWTRRTVQVSFTTGFNF
jgi:motility/secretion related protein SprA